MLLIFGLIKFNKIGWILISGIAYTLAATFSPTTKS